MSLLRKRQIQNTELSKAHYHHDVIKDMFNHFQFFFFSLKAAHIVTSGASSQQKRKAIDFINFSISVFTNEVKTLHLITTCLHPQHNDKVSYGTNECMVTFSVSSPSQSLSGEHVHQSHVTKNTPFLLLCVPYFWKSFTKVPTISMTASHQLLLGLVAWHVFTHSYPFAVPLSSEGAPAISEKGSGGDGHLREAASAAVFVLSTEPNEKKTTLIFDFEYFIFSFTFPLGFKVQQWSLHSQALVIISCGTFANIYLNHTQIMLFRVSAKSGFLQGFILEMKENDTTMTNGTKANCGADLTNTAWALFV